MGAWPFLKAPKNAVHETLTKHVSLFLISFLRETIAGFSLCEVVGGLRGEF